LAALATLTSWFLLLLPRLLTATALLATLAALLATLLLTRLLLTSAALLTTLLTALLLSALARILICHDAYVSFYGGNSRSWTTQLVPACSER
jgi:hypothetical protein